MQAELGQGGWYAGIGRERVPRPVPQPLPSVPDRQEEPPIRTQIPVTVEDAPLPQQPSVAQPLPKSGEVGVITIQPESPIDIAQQPPPPPAPVARATDAVLPRVQTQHTRAGEAPQIQKVQTKVQSPEKIETHSRWSVDARFRLMANNIDALHTAREFVGEEITPTTEGLYKLHPRVSASLQAHLREIQEREWGSITIPVKKTSSQQEKERLALWKNNKKTLASILQRTIVPHTSTGKKITPQEVSEQFAYQLSVWMDECARSLIAVSTDRTISSSTIAMALSLIGIVEVPKVHNGRIRGKKDTFYSGLWTVYQQFFSEGKNSTEEFVHHIARGVKARNNGIMNTKELYEATKVFKALPLFGKEGNLMHAIELAIDAVSQDYAAYPRGYIIKPLDPTTPEGKILAFIGQKAPGIPSRRTILFSGEEEDEIAQ